MPFSISCPSCQTSYQVPDERIGKNARCKKCGERFSLSIVTNPDAQPVREGAADFSEEAFLDRVRRRDDEEEPTGKFGRYEIVKRLGNGGMGAVYLARDERLGRLVALKVPLKRFAHHPEVAERFAREARIGATFQHPRFCPVFDLDRIDDRPVLAMGYVEGETLAERLKRSSDGRLSETEAAAIVREVALALSEAHRRGIIHRDLKPSNIMIDVGGEPIVMDFGLAKRADGGDESLTATGSPIGTPHYMPPEQVRGDKESMTAASDVYSLGVVLYELLTGRRPFEGSMTSVFVQIAVNPPEKPSRLLPGLSASLEAACLKAMAKEPKDRHESMRAFAEALLLREPVIPPTPAPIRVEVLVHPPLGGRAEIVKPPDESGESKGWIGLIVIAAVAALAAGTLFGQWLNRPAPPIAKPAQQPLDVIENSIGMKLVLIPDGTFEMGSDDSDKDAQADEKKDGKKHRVRITKPFWLGQTEVTVGQFRKFADTGYKTEAERDGKGGWGFDQVKGTFAQDPKYTWRNPGFKQEDDHPVVNVNWNDAVAFCEWLGKKEGPTYRLPTEAEWEYACRAGTTTRYSNGDDPKRLSIAANIADRDLKLKVPNYPLPISEINDGFPFTAPAGRFAPNAFKLYDMHGNVWEWCSDGYDAAYYRVSPVDDPCGPSQASDRVSCGGSWCVTAVYARSAYRSRFTPESRYFYLGFRVARLQSAP